MSTTAQLIRQLQSKDSRVRERAARRLDRAGAREALPALLERLQVETNHAALMAVIGAIGAMKDPDTIPALMDAARPVNRWGNFIGAMATGAIRHAIIGALFEIEVDVYPALQAALDDPDEGMQKFARLALSMLKFKGIPTV